MYPVLLSFSGFEIRSFGVIVLLAWGVGRSIARRRALAAGLDDSLMGACWFWGFIAALVGARLPGLIFMPFDGTPPRGLIESVQQGGLSSVGALIVSGFVTLAILFVNRKVIGHYADAAVAGVLLSLALCRLGCFLNGCCYGVATESWWGCAFDPDSPAGRYSALTCHAHLVPTQLMLAFGNIGLCVFILNRRKSQETQGVQYCVLAALYVAMRLVVSCWRVE